MGIQADFWRKTILIANKIFDDGDNQYQILSLFKVNPTGISLKTKLTYAALFLEIVNSSIGITSNLLSFKQVESQIIVLPISSEEKSTYLDSLSTQKQNALETRIDEETEKIFSNLELSNSQTNDIERKSNLRIIVKNMYNFILSGGSVTLNDVSESDFSKLNKSFSEIPSQMKRLKEERQKLENPVLPKAVLNSEEKDKFDNLKSDKIKRGRPKNNEKIIENNNK